MLKPALLLVLVFSSSAFAFVRTMSDSGRPLYWPIPQISMRVNPTNTSGLSDGQVGTIFQNAFAAWSTSGSRASANVATSAGYPAASGHDGVNSVYFSSRGGRRLDDNVIAVTEVLYYLSSGSIVEADMVFNDNRFRFTNSEGDTGKVIGGRTAIYLQDVATHEAGHAFGLDHSTVNLSSMIYTAYSGQFVPSSDDLNGVRTIYANGGTRGAIHGQVVGLSGGIFGAHVEAINLETGKVEAGALAGSDGGVRIGDLPPGKYAVMTEPYGASISSISSYYQNVNHRFCSGDDFRRRFYAACGSSRAAVVEVADGRTTELGTLTPSCSQMGNPEGSPTSLASARTLAPGSVFGTLRPGETHYYRLSGVAGDLAARAMAFSLYSPLDLSVRFLDESGNPLAGATTVENIEAPMRGGNTNYDSRATASVTTGNYIVAVSAAGARIPSPKYSAGSDLLDSDGHYLLALSVDGDLGNSALPDMSACVSVANRPQGATFRAPASTKEDKKYGAGCGTIGSSGGPPLSGGIAQLLLAAALLQVFMRFKRRVRALVRTKR